jgi:large-conductance mechanosensitive channel
LKLLSHTQKTVIVISIAISFVYLKFHNWSILVVAALVLILGLSISSFQNWLHHYWMKLAEVLSKIFNPITLGAVFFFVVTPLSLLQRLLKKNSLQFKSKDNTAFRDMKKRFTKSDFEKPW